MNYSDELEVLDSINGRLDDCIKQLVRKNINYSNDLLKPINNKVNIDSLKKQVKMLREVLMQSRKEFVSKLIASLKAKECGEYIYREFYDGEDEVSFFLLKAGCKMKEEAFYDDPALMVDKRFSKLSDDVIYIGNDGEGDKVDLYEFAKTFRYGNSTYSPELVTLLTKFVNEQLANQMEKSISEKKKKSISSSWDER